MTTRTLTSSPHRLACNTQGTSARPWSSHFRLGVLGLAVWACAGGAYADPNFPISAAQRSTAEQVAQAGVPLSELSPTAPASHTVKPGDTLWDISALFLKHPWRWPELWGMNKDQIRNPHLIFPGQVLVLTRVGDRAMLTVGGASNGTIKLSPRIRAENLSDAATPPIPLSVIEPFLVDSLIVDEAVHNQAPRIVATPENRVLLSRGDRAYARGQYSGKDATSGEALSTQNPRNLNQRVFRNATVLKDPATGDILGYEAQFIGNATLVRSEGDASATPDKSTDKVVPATIDITYAKEELRVGDRLLPSPERETPVYIPHAPAKEISGQVVKVHGSAVRNAGQYQVIVINRGAQDGLERGHVLAIQKNASTLPDPTDSSKPMMQLPGERNGLMLVFRTFERVSYALVLNISDGVQVGDSFVNP